MAGIPGLAGGLGFQAEPPNTKAPTIEGQLKIFGLEGVKEATYVPSPRYKNGEEVMRALMEEKYGVGGLSSPAYAQRIRRAGGYQPQVAEQIASHPRSRFPEWTYEAAAAYIDYCVERYGQCPVYFNPMQCNFGAVVHHVDDAFYDQLYVKGYVTDAIRGHFQTWH